MAKASLSFDGFSDYLSELARAGKDIDLVAEEALAVGSAVLVAGMERRAPYEIIRAAIRKTHIMRDGNKRYLYVGILRGTDAETARIANTWEFGGPGEDGHGKKRQHRHIPARPFIRPTLRTDWKKARTAMEDVFQEWLKG